MSGRMRVGFVSVWFERGQAYVTKAIRDAIAPHAQTHVLARLGGVLGKRMLLTEGFWAVPNLTPYPSYQIPPDYLTGWIRQNRLDAVIFNEEYDWAMVRAAKAAGAKVLTYLDFYHDKWKDEMGLYDAVLCSTRRSHNMVKAVCPAHYMGWAVDTKLFRPRPETPARYTFFHNAGWLGIGFRKMTPAAILAFEAVSRAFPHTSLLIHAQVPLKHLPPWIIKLVMNNPRITYREETLPAPGLYHLASALVYPSKLEGLGLPLFEGLASGLAVVATDAPPMNEFIKDGENGLLARVAHRTPREDGIAFLEELVDVNHLVMQMARLAADPEEMRRMGQEARTYAESQLSMADLGARVMAVLEALVAGGGRPAQTEYAETETAHA